MGRRPRPPGCSAAAPDGASPLPTAPPGTAYIEIVADAWVIGAPRGTLLVTLMGTASTLGDLDPDAVAGAIVPLTGPGL